MSQPIIKIEKNIDISAPIALAAYAMLPEKWKRAIAASLKLK